MSEWTTGDECTLAEDCSWAEQFTGATIYLTPEIQAVIRKLCKDIKTEWQMLLTGEENKDGVWVTGYWIPKQEVTGSTVANLDVVDKDVIATRKIVCTIHSHADMGVFFSGTDEKFTNNSLIKNHIVVNNKGNMKATMRYELPCKMTKFFDATVVGITPVIDIVEGAEKIVKKIITIPDYTGMGYKGTYADNNWFTTDKRKSKKGKGKAKGKKKKYHALTNDVELQAELNEPEILTHP